jgi:hypothetical protein
MGRSRKTTTNSMPEFQKQFLTETLLPFATEFSQQEFTPYTGEMVAGVSPLSMGTQQLFSQMGQTGAMGTQAANLYGNLAVPPAMQGEAGDFFRSGAQTTGAERAASNLYGQLGDISNMSPEDFAAMTTANMSPYLNQVLDASLSRIGRERDIARTQEMAELTRRGAFGNEGRGVFEAERAAAYEIGRDQLIANLMQQGYTQAQAQTMAQLGMQQGAAGQAAAGLAQLGGMERAGLQAGAAGLAGLSQAQQSALQSAASGLQQAERDRLAGLGQSAAGMMQLGNLEQLTAQAGLDAQMQEFMRQQNFPLQQLGALVSAAGGVPAGYGTTTETKKPGFTDILGAVGSAGQALTLISDRRLKTNVRKIGERDGVAFYSWDWNEKARELGAESHPTKGVIAQELAEIHPDLVVTGPHGFQMVNYVGLQERL